MIGESVRIVGLLEAGNTQLQRSTNGLDTCGGTPLKTFCTLTAKYSREGNRRRQNALQPGQRVYELVQSIKQIR